MDADGVGQFAVRGVAQQQFPTAGDDRGVRLRNPELLQQPIYGGVGLHVQPGEQHAVFGQEVADAEGIGGVTGADHPQAGELRRLAQDLPPGNERLEEEVAQGRALVQDPLQGDRGELIYLCVTSGDGAVHRRGAHQERDFAGVQSSRRRVGHGAAGGDDLDERQLVLRRGRGR